MLKVSVPQLALGYLGRGFVTQNDQTTETKTAPKRPQAKAFGQNENSKTVILGTCASE